MKTDFKLVDQLRQQHTLDDDGFLALIQFAGDAELSAYLRANAREVAQGIFGNGVYIRGLIEFTNYCKNNCYYCGIRAGNKSALRYRLSKEEVLTCCRTGYTLGFRTFVLQGGEDPHFAEADMADLLSAIRQNYPDCAITLSFGEKPREVYQMYRDAGADRYLLRHETADAAHYAKLHPGGQALESRKKCLYVLKELGFQVGTGFMVGSPYQTPQTILKDIRFIEALQPQMLGVGPYLPHKDTPFGDMPKGSLELTLNLLAICRLMMPRALIPATTALGTVSGQGREQGILAGANVVMPNLSPADVRKKYMLYNGKVATGEEAAESRHKLEKTLEKIGYKIADGRGDYGAANVVD